MELFRKTYVYVMLAVCLIFCSCGVYRVSNYCRPPVPIPCHFYHHEPGKSFVNDWWREFKQPDLNDVVEATLCQNLDIKQAWARLAQARADVCIAAASKIPEISLTNTFDFRHQYERSSDSASDTAKYLVKPTLSYEIDLWKRIDSNVKSKQMAACASYQDLEATALLIAGVVTDLWFIIQEIKALLKLNAHQVEVSKTFLDLVELRFQLGEASALDVYQQRLQYEETVSQAIPDLARLKRAWHQLNILMGNAPDDGRIKEPGLSQIDLPVFPELGLPCELLMHRPDLRAEYYRVEAADYDVAVAVADIFPKLTLPTSWELNKRNVNCWFEEQILSVAIQAVTPIIDGCRRQCEVRKREARVRELLSRFGQRFLVALAEVEDAVVTEKSQLDFLKQLNLEIDIAKQNLSEATQRYATGLNDYLTVIAAIQSLQRLERRVIFETRILLANRANLYRALGGAGLVGCRSCKPLVYQSSEGTCCEQLVEIKSE